MLQNILKNSSKCSLVVTLIHGCYAQVELMTIIQGDMIMLFNCLII